MSEKWQLVTKQSLDMQQILRAVCSFISSHYTAAKCYWVLVRAEEQLKNTKHPKYQAVHALPQSGLKSGIAFIFYFKSTVLPMEDHCLGKCFSMA